MSKLLLQFNPMIDAVLEKSKKLGYYTVIRIHQHEQFNLVYKNSKVDRTSVVGDIGIGMYVFTKSGHVAFGSTNDCTVKSWMNLFDNLSSIASKNQEESLNNAVEIYQLQKQENLGQDQSHYQQYDISSIDIDWIVSHLALLDRHARTQDSSLKTLFEFNIEIDTWRIVRSDGTDVDWTVPKSRVQLSMTLKKNSQTVNGRLRMIDTTPELLFSDMSHHKDKLSATIKMLKEQLYAVPLESDKYPIIIDADLGGMLAHEALGHPAESDLVESNGSVLANEDVKYRAGQKIAHSEVTVEDHEEDLSHGYHPYGAFGNARLPVTIIDKGTLKESVSDIFSSHSIGVDNKNCERSETYFSPAIPRMSNTYISMNKVKKLSHPKGSNLNDPYVLQSALKELGIFKSHPKIAYLIEMAGGMVTPVTGDFMFGTCYVYELSEDKVESKKPVSFSGNVLGALEALEYGIGDVEKNTAGFCGKAEQTAHVRSGGNKLLFFSPTDKIKVV